MLFKKFSPVLFCLLLHHVMSAQIADDRINIINANWEFVSSNETKPQQLSHLENWESITLPHSWNSLDATDMLPGYRKGAGWYKKNLQINLKEDQQYLLYFEGANITTQVYVNSNLAGGHIGGYVGFEIDMTTYLKNGNNEILVRVDNGQNIEVIPSSKSDFFIFGGITRDVWLKTIPKHANLQKIKVSTSKVSRSQADASFDIALGGSQLKGYALEVTVLDPKGKKVFSKKQNIKSQMERIDFKGLKNPMLWDVDNPHLYTVSAKLLKNDEVIDIISDRYGYRWFEFKEHGAFYLNGERLKLRGTHRHEEHAGYGAAVPNEIHRQDMEMIKEMGANMVRLAHYPQDPEVYKACDELGLIVWDELPWCRGGLGNDAWKANTRRLLAEMIEQNYNHPSIVFWSLGNEIYWLADFDGGDNRAAINIYLTELNELAHELDPNRLTSIRKYYEGAHIPDVFSPSIWSGWYSGKYTDYESSIQNAMEKYPRFLHAEYGGSSHLGRHNEKIRSLDEQIESSLGNEAIVQVGQINYAQDGDWSENYIVDLFDWHLKVSETTPEFAGNIQWAFKDFGTPLRPENDIPYMNQKGLVDREGNPKDAYYVFKSYWAEQPFTYIESKTWTERYGEANESKKLSVYSNCSEVSLLLNGQSLGNKQKNIEDFPASGLTWDVSFSEGKNQLIAIGHHQGQEVYDTLSLTYYTSPPNKPVELTLDYEKQSDGSFLITAIAADNHGRRSTDYEKKVYFQCLNGGKLRESFGTPTGSSVIAMANGKASIRFFPDAEAQSAMVSVLNQDFKGTYLEIPLKQNEPSK